MKNKKGYVKKEDRKKILLFTDDIRLPSGVGGVAREIVIHSSHRYNWVNVGAAIKHPEQGKIVDISKAVNNETGLEDSSVKVIPNNGYGDAGLLRKLLEMEKPDAIMIFTDPRYFDWLFDLEREIRSKIPIIYLNIWDNYPAPLYNREFYDSVDTLLAISKQTKNINEIVLGERAEGKIIEYLPHGINEKMFFPIEEDYQDYNKFLEFKRKLFKEKDIEFVVLFNSRNIRRKAVPDTILAYRYFCDLIGKEKAKKCALVLHTSPVDPNGTDLHAVKEALCDPDYVNVYFSADKLSVEQMNLLYNVSDVNILLSSNEGWGLSLTEAMMAGKLIVCNVTGGMQDQCRFTDEEGNWIDFSPTFPSNNRGTFKNCGEWAFPVFPSNLHIQGSPVTPYIWDDRCRPEDAAQSLLEVFNLSAEERKQRGVKAREWVTSEESGMSVTQMSNNFIEYCDRTFEEFIPRDNFEVIKIQDSEPNYINHELLNYSYE